jgi:hypothetical membrane protein
MCFKNLNKKIKNLDIWDIGLTKLAVASAVLFILGIWPSALKWTLSISPWYFLIAAIIFAIRPVYKTFK